MARARPEDGYTFEPSRPERRWLMLKHDLSTEALLALVLTAHAERVAPGHGSSETLKIAARLRLRELNGAG